MRKSSLASLVALTFGVTLGCNSDDTAVSGSNTMTGDTTVGMDESGGMDSMSADESATMTSDTGDGDSGDGDGTATGDGSTGDGDGSASGDGDGTSGGDGDGGTGDGDGDGSSTTAGDGDGDGTATGDGDGSATGDGDGTATGDGDGTASGDGDGTASGDGDGTATGDGDGTATGDGDGDGDGDGTTAATGDGDGDGTTATTGDGDGTTTGDGDGTTTGDGDGTTTGDGDGTTTGDGDGTTTGDGDGTTTGDGDGTTTGDGDGTTTGDGDGTTTGDGDGTTTGDGDGTTTGDGDGTTTGDGDGTTTGDGDGTTTGDGDGTTSGDGDGDGDGTTAGDGDGDGATGDGDGTTAGDGDGDGDGTTGATATGDGDGDGTATATGDGDGDGTTTGDGDGTATGDGDGTATGDGDGDGTTGCVSVCTTLDETRCTGTDLETCSDVGGGCLDWTFTQDCTLSPNVSCGGTPAACEPPPKCDTLTILGALDYSLDQESTRNAQSWGAVLNEAFDSFGASLAVGDFNNDGFDDLAIGAPGENSNGANADTGQGRVFIAMGSVNGLSPGNILDQTAFGNNEASDVMGFALATGDYNNDGFDDLVVGVPGENSATGGVAVFLGSGIGLSNAVADGATQATLGCTKADDPVGGPNESNDQLGFTLTTGDYNNDGFDDIVSGVPGENNTGAAVNGEGAICVIAGGPTAAANFLDGRGAMFDSTALFSFTATEAFDRFGEKVASGVFSNGANGDLVVGSPGENTNQGRASISFGVGGAATPASGFFNQNNGWFFGQGDAGGANENQDFFGRALGVGDYNCDGLDDLIVGAPNEDDLVTQVPVNFRPGAVFGFVGDLTPFADTAPPNRIVDQASYGANNDGNDLFGFSIVLGDLDGDGDDDVVIGQPAEGTGLVFGHGAITIIPGSENGMVMYDSCIAFQCEESGAVCASDTDCPATVQHDQGSIGLGANEPGDAFGTTVAMGDFNGNGRMEMVVSSPAEAPGADPAAGSVWIGPVGLCPGF